MLAFALCNNPRAICLIKIISKWRGNASQKIDAIRKELLRATHETENSIVISFFFPVGNPFTINSFSTCILAIDNCSIATIR